MPRRRNRTEQLKQQQVKPITLDELIFYILYARRSLEDDEKQKESIPQQLEKMYSYWQVNELPLLLRDVKTFPIDEQTLAEIEQAYEKDPESTDRIRNFYLKYAIVTERKSAKEPGKRPAWNRVIEMVRQGTVRGILSYSPDRMARNLQEGGEVLQLIDRQLLTVKFTNFVFEDTQSGHMMLGIYFVFAEHYSKKLSEDSTRGTVDKSMVGKAIGVSKLGYTTTEDDYWIQHPTNAPILRQAFERKMYESWSDQSIAEEMNKNGWEDKKPMTGARISDLNVWQDSFYYGLWERTYKKEGVITIPLLELKNHPFEPLVTEEEFYTLQKNLERRNKKSLEQRRSRNTKLLDTATPLGKGIVISSDTSQRLRFTIPNKSRHIEKLEALKIEKSKAVYGDVIAPHQIKYCLNGNNTTFEALDKFIYKHIKKVQLGEYEKQAFLYQFQMEAENLHKANQSRKKRILILKNKTEGDRDQYKNESRFGIGLTHKDKRLYNRKIDTFNTQISEYSENLKAVEDRERDEIFELQAFSEVFLNIADLWKKANYVQKRKISEILILNILVKNGKPVTMRVKPELESLFPDLIRDGGPARWNFEQILSIVKSINLGQILPVVQFYVHQVPNLKCSSVPKYSERQKVIYEL